MPSQVAMRERLTLAPEQVRALLDELEEMFQTMVLLAVLSGLRRGEIFGLRWKCVNFQENSIIVSEANYEGTLQHQKPEPLVARCSWIVPYWTP